MSAITEAVQAVVDALAGVAPRVDRVRLRPLPANTTTAVVVRPEGADVLQASDVSGLPISWDARLVVECYAKTNSATAPDLAVDDLTEQVYSRLMADPTLGGAVVILQPLSVAYDFDAEGDLNACALFTFNARLRTAGAVF